MQRPVTLIPRSRPPRHTKEDGAEKSGHPETAAAQWFAVFLSTFLLFFIKNK